MKKHMMLFGMAILAVTLLSTFTSIASAADFSLPNLTLMQTAPLDATAQAPVKQGSWGQLKTIYRSSTTSTEAVKGDSTAASNRAQMARPGAGTLSIGTYPNFVRNECWYTLDHDWLYRGDDPNGPGGNGTESNWNWLSKNADGNANGLRFALHQYGGYVSDLIPGYGGDLTDSQENYWTDQLSANSYALGFRGSSSGHGCQCVSFVAMVIYRATGGRVQLNWNWAAMNSGYAPATSARPGDIVFHTSGFHHVGICVINYGSGITVVDSNSQGNEVIRRHNVSNTEINNVGWKVMSGAGIWR